MCRKLRKARTAFDASIKIPPQVTNDNAGSRCAILEGMDHIEVLREKIAGLRGEIAQIKELNDQYRDHGRNQQEAQIAHGQRLERLQQIQQELAQLAGLSRRVLSVEERKEEHRSKLHLNKKVS